jgi:peptidoglycan hydrolase CwlO-like protein
METKNKSVRELEAERMRLYNELKDLEDTFNFNMANTPDHHNEAMVREHEDEIEEYRQRIHQVEEAIKTLKG